MSKTGKLEKASAERRAAEAGPPNQRLAAKFPILANREFVVPNREFFAPKPAPITRFAALSGK